MMAQEAEWIIVADAAQARFLTRAEPAAFHTIKIVPAAGVVLNALAGKAPGALAGGVPGHQARDRFAALVAAHLNAAAGARLFERLVLVAPEGLLQALEADLDHPARSCVIARIAQDPAGLGDAALAARLPPWPAGH